MMSVEEYALDIKKTTQEVLKKCQELNIKIEDEEEDFLTQDDIIMLDNAFSLLNDEVEVESEVLLEAIEDEEEIVVKKKKPVKKEKKVKLDKSNYKKLEKLQAHTPEVLETLDTVIHYNDGMTVGEFAKKINVPAVKIIKNLFDLGKMIGINNVLDFDTAAILAIDAGFELINEAKALEHDFEKFEVVDSEADLEYRSPVITIMGHVDHGKTTLLDTIRKTNVLVTDSEFGGITQHIGAYQVEYLGKKITFLDTPGHAAFSQMRARGAGVTDIVIIVVAADDGVMPQTIEAIDHAKAAKVPIIVAVNKVDRPDSNIERVMTELSNHGLMPEEWGGETIFVPISAKMNQNIDGLLETITLIADVEEFKANPKRYALGTVIESHLDKGRGAVATLLIQNGTLRLGDPIVVGSTYGRVRKMMTANGEEILVAPPSTPVEIIGLNAVPEAGDNFMAFETEKEARQVGEKRAAQSSVSNRNSSSAISLEDLFSHIEASNTKDINILLKTDVQGTAEAIKSSLSKIEVDGVRVKIIRATAGAVTESDVMLASAGNAIIIGFNVRPDAVVRAAAEREKVELRLYNVIYNILNDVEAAMKGMLDPEFEEEILGRAEVRQTFKVTKFGIIAGSYVTEGKILSDALVRVIRDGITIYDGAIDNLKRFKDDVKEVKAGFECGITIEKFSDIKEKDIFEAYRMVEIKRK